MLSQQQKRSAPDTYLAFEYQWDFFVLEVLNLLEDNAIVSFECLDDIAKQSDNSVILYQVKHSIRQGADGKTVNLTSRDSDLWKTISIWMKFIEEDNESNKEEYINNTVFVLVTNKSDNNNTFFNALQNYKQNGNFSNFKIELSSIKSSGIATSEVSNIIQEFLDAPYLEQFAQRIQINFISNELEPKIKSLIGKRFALKETKIDGVYDHLMTKMRDDAKESIRKRQKVQYDCYTIQKRYWSIIQEGREKLVFRTDYPRYDGDPRDLMFIQQLIAVNDIKKEDCDDIANYTNEWFLFHNNFRDMWDNHDINDRDVQNLTNNVFTVWNNCQKYYYRRLSIQSPVQDLEDAASNLLISVRKEQLTIADTSMGPTLSNGCFYYYSNNDSAIVSDMPRIGWHINWKKLFKKDEQNL